MRLQNTVASPISISGKGLHTGQQVTVTFEPAPADSGIWFMREDLPGMPRIQATPLNVFDTSRGTAIRHEEAAVHTIEHLMAALTGLGIDNVLIRTMGPETPILDGSSRIYVEKLQEAGIRQLDQPCPVGTVSCEIEYEQPEQHIRLCIRPADHFRMTVHIDYGTQVLASQNAEILNMENFYPDIYNCRTFVFLDELQFLIAHNLVRGGDVDNAIVFVDKVPDAKVLRQLADFFHKADITVTPNHILNNVCLHHENEPARHKLLDLIGDMALLGCPLQAEIVAERPGHTANIAFAKKIMESPCFHVTK